MNVSDPQTFAYQRASHTTFCEALLIMLLFASMGAITWAIRGTSGWSGIDGTILPGMTWGVLWWYVCWRKGIDARSVPLWLGLGIALGGELGYGQYVSWIRGMFNVGEETISIARWIGYAWFAVCGIGWGGPGGIVLGWALAGRKSLGVWVARFIVPVGAALLMRRVVQAWPGLFFPNWNLGIYTTNAAGSIDVASTLSSQTIMHVALAVSTILAIWAWMITARMSQPSAIVYTIVTCAMGFAGMLLVAVSDWLFFPEDQLNLFAGELGPHLGRTLYTNAQNAVVVGWWLGAIVVAVVQRDRFTVVAGLALGIGFAIAFPLSALWCLGYEYAPDLVDWWKMWELNSGFYLGMLYVSVLCWAIRQVDGKSAANRFVGISQARQWSETVSIAVAVFLVIYVMAREEFLIVGVLLGLFYFLFLVLATTKSVAVSSRRQAVSFVYSIFLLVFMLAWGVTAQTGILLGLYEADAIDQYAWPTARIAIFAPFGLLIAGISMLKMWQATSCPRFAVPPITSAPEINFHIVDLLAFIGVVGAASIWPAKISVFYALFLAIALFSFNRLSRTFDRIDHGLPQDI